MVRIEVTQEMVDAHRKVWEDAGIKYGLCLCGCGEQAPISKQNHTQHKWVRGEPKFYVPTHHRRGVTDRPITSTELTCNQCGETKAATEFEITRSTKWGAYYRGTCRLCRSQKRAVFYRKKKYGVTPERFEQMMEEQEGRCWICQVEFSREIPPCVDHCHDTNVVRGLLCTNCNTGIGLLKHNSEIMSRAIEWVTKWQE